MERVELLKALRLGEFDVLVGINLLREGLDLPEVSLIAILDADKEGFLRSERSLIQIFGRAARHVDGHVILYADTVTDSMRGAMEVTARRREKQDAFNKEHGIIPKGIVKKVQTLPEVTKKATDGGRNKKKKEKLTPGEKAKMIERLRFEMLNASKRLDFETAAVLRDRIRELQSEK